VKVGICNGCQRWRVVIRLPVCRCTTVQHPPTRCPAPRFTDWFCRDHAPCGPRRPPRDVTDLDLVPRPTGARS
jgi:hypothetical protein